MARDIHLEGFRTEESKGLFSLAKDMISSWMEKPQEKSTAVWLGEEFIQRVGGMTAEAAQLPWEVLSKVTTRIVNEVRGVNRVLYDCTGKPPATIELE